MRFRYLRIAFSATCLIACVLLIAFWVRSYWRIERAEVSNQTSQWFMLASAHGVLKCGSGGNVNPFSLVWTGNWELTSTAYLSSLPARHLGFTYTHRPMVETVLTVPHWFLVGVAGGLAVAPWLKLCRRFSL